MGEEPECRRLQDSQPLNECKPIITRPIQLAYPQLHLLHSCDEIFSTLSCTGLFTDSPSNLLNLHNRLSKPPINGCPPPLILPRTHQNSNALQALHGIGGDNLARTSLNFLLDLSIGSVMELIHLLLVLLFSCKSNIQKRRGNGAAIEQDLA